MDKLPSRDVSQSVKRFNQQLCKERESVWGKERNERGMEDQLTNIPLETFGLDVSVIYAHWQDSARLTHGTVVDLDFVLTLFFNHPKSASN